MKKERQYLFRATGLQSLEFLAEPQPAPLPPVANPPDIKLVHTVESDPLDIFLERIIYHLKGVSKLEIDFDKLDISDSQYRTILPFLEQAREALSKANRAYQDNVRIRPQSRRNIDASKQYQCSNKRR
jgi:hypothetical protein